MKKLYVIFLALMCSAILVTADPTTGLQFSGDAASFIDLGQQAAFSPDQFTIEVWVNYEALNNGYILSNEGYTEATGGEGFSLRSSNSNIELVLGANTEWVSLKSKSEIEVDTWYHIAATYSGTEMKLYINGELDTTQTVESPMITSTQSTSIGEGSMWKGRRITGKMSDLRFWNVVRSGDDIAANTTATLTGEESGLVAAWKMEEGTGATVADITGVYNITKPEEVSWFAGNIEQPVEADAPTKGLIFDGSANSLVDLGADEAIASPTEFTVEALVNYSSVDGGYIISSEGAPTGTTAQGYSLRLNSGKLDFTIGAGESWVGITDTGNVSLDTWHHVAATYSSSAMTLYLDGIEVASVADPATIGASSQNVFIGEGSMWKGRGLRGQLGYVRMWSTAKTKEEIRDNANTYVTGSEANLLAAWNNNVQDETVLAEVTGAYPGTIGADVAWFGFDEEDNPIAVMAPGKGLIFNGEANSLVDLGVNETIGSPAEFTIEALVNYSSSDGGYIIASEGAPTGTTTQGYSLRLSSGKPEFSFGIGDGWGGITAADTISLNEWHHVSVTYDSTAMTLFVDGLAVATAESPAAIGASAQNVIIGEGSMWKGRGLRGQLGYVRMWDVPKTKEEIRSDANSYVTGSEPDLLAAWNNNVQNDTVLAEITDTYPGTIGADVAWFGFGVDDPIVVTSPDKGLVFNGDANSLVDIGVGEAIASPAEFTIEALVNYSSVEGGYVIASEGAPTGTSTQGYSLRLSGGKLEFSYGTGDNWGGVADTSNIALDTWHHVAVSYSSSALMLFLDGVEVGYVENPAAIGTSSQNVIIGEGSMWKGRGLRGKMGYIRMWSVAKNKEEIRGNANTYVTGLEDNLLAAWNNDVQDETTLEEMTTIYPGMIGADVAWFGFETGIDPINTNNDIEAFVHGKTMKIANRTNSKLTYSIYNFMGQKLVEGFVGAGGTYQKELSQFSGSYILKCSTGNGRVIAKKFVVAQ